MPQEVANLQGDPGTPVRVGASRGIFVSYRRQDSQGSAGRLTDGLERTFGKETVFRDIGAIRPGMNFVTEIEDALKSCVVLLAVIGPNWLPRLQSFGSQPNDGHVDYLRWELKTALKRGIRIIPVLVDGACMPGAKDLPPELTDFAMLQAHELTDKRWEEDMRQLFELLKEELRPPAINATTKVVLDSRVVILTLLGVTALIAVGVLSSSAPSVSASDIETMGPKFIRNLVSEHAADGSIAVLLAGALVILLRTFLAKYRDALAGRFGEWLKDSHVFGVLTACLVVVPLLVVVDRVVLAAALISLAVTYLMARRFLPRMLATPVRFGVCAACMVVVLAGALWADIALDKDKQTTFDVAFLLPPEGGSSDSTTEKQQVFDEINKALRVVLRDAKNLEIVPERLTDNDFNQYGLFNKQALLAKKWRKGYARVFIRVKYNLDQQSGVRRISVRPYFRTVDKTDPIRELDDWQPPRIEGRATSPIPALKASFALITGLSSRRLVKLDHAELQQILRTLLLEYGEALALTTTGCASIRDMVTTMRQQKELEVNGMRDVIFNSCVDGPPSVTTTVATNREIATAAAPYRSVLEH